MPYDRFLIAPIETGLETDLKSWLIPDDAYERLNNAYVFRGRVRKRFGSTFTGTDQLSSRLRVFLKNTDGAGAAAGKVPGDTFKVGQMFSIGTEIFTVYDPAAGDNPMYTTGASTTCTYKLADGSYVFAGSTPATPVYFYPSEPVMGLTMYESGAINTHMAIAFDTQFAYQFSGGAWLKFGPTTQFNGDETDFFWSCNWQGATADAFALFTTNFNATVGAPGATDDPIWYYDGTWHTFVPVVRPAGHPQVANMTINSARIVVPFRNRLVLLNTIENDGTAAPGVNHAFVNRCRYSHAADPTSTTAWWEPNITVGANYSTGGGYIDAPTMEQIVSAQFIKDRLIVYFERSTWELAYTGNQVLPFVWNKLNTELGVEATFSVVPFDQVVLGIGTTGIHQCNGSNVSRIDDKIPDKVFDLVHKPDAVKRIAGIRDYKTEAVYWAAPMNPQDSDALFPDTVLVYNYKNNSWAFNNDSFTAFGYFEQQDGRTWVQSNFSWNSTSYTWLSGVSRAQYRCIIAGNQQGFVLKIDPDENKNSPALCITDINTPALTQLTIIDHNLTTGDYIKITNASGVTDLNDNIYQVTYVDTANVTIGNTGFTGSYLGGGIVARVSQVDILTKQWNPYVKDGRNFFLAKVDFCTQRTSDGQMTIDYYPSSTKLSLINASMATGCNLGTNVLETSPYTYVPLETLQDRTWHPIYFSGEGEFVQLRIYLSDTQMVQPLVAEAPFELEGLILHCMPTTTRMQ